MTARTTSRTSALLKLSVKRPCASGTTRFPSAPSPSATNAPVPGQISLSAARGGEVPSFSSEAEGEAGGVAEDFCSNVSSETERDDVGLGAVAQLERKKSRRRKQARTAKGLMAKTP